MAPKVQKKIDFPVKKSSHTDHKSLQLTPKKSSQINDRRVEIDNINKRTPTKRLKENCDAVTCSPPKRGKENNESSPKKLINKPKFRLLENKIVDDAYKNAKCSLNTACPERILGREAEIKSISSFLDAHLSAKKSGSLYVSGPPGTGKTACLTHLLKALDLKVKFKSVFINCMTLKKSQDIFKKIAIELGNENCKSGKDSLKFLDKKFSSAGPMILLVLDEIDHLDSKNQDVLYSIYEWSKLKKSRLVLIGVANALDLTDRVLPRLKACNITPELLNFAPYSKNQIQSILEDRLCNIKSGDQNVFKPIAVQFCARKISACAGDIRKALDVCRRAIELVEADLKKPVLKSSNAGDSKIDVKFKQVDLPHISAVLRSVYESRMSTSSQSFSQIFPLQQKVLIGTLFLLVSKGKNKEVTIGKLHEVYIKICRNKQISEISQSEFDSMCSMIDNHGIISIKAHKERRLSKIRLKIDENELQHVMQDHSLLSSILEQQSLL